MRLRNLREFVTYLDSRPIRVTYMYERSLHRVADCYNLYIDLDVQNINEHPRSNGRYQ